ncbi:MAG TPA: condensation domain-containing protein [Polyangium sp.]|nr:condensation domain-containing protein [Polyangium sp.]
MSVQPFIDELRQIGVVLSQRDGKLLCNAPKGVLTDELRQRISRAKPDLISFLSLEQKQSSFSDSIPIVERGEALPLSFSQERIWKLSKVVPERNVTGNIGLSLRIEGPLQVNALLLAIQEIVHRHEVFRSSCKVVEGQPRLAISAHVPIDVPVCDLRHLNGDDKIDKIRQEERDFTSKPFDLEVARMLRAMLLQVDDDSHVVLLVTHVFAFDGWSTPILLRELSSLYGDFAAGKSAALPPLAIGYADFAAWQRQWFHEQRWAEQKTHWKKTLSDTSLVAISAKDKGLSSATATITFPDFLARSVRDVSKQSGVTLFFTLMAGFQTLLQRYTLQRSTAVGTIVSSRRGAATESIIGSFSNNVLIRADFPPRSTFRSVLYQLRDAARGTYSNQDLPFEHLLDELDAPFARNPAFRVMFVFHQHQAMENAGLQLAGLTTEMRPVDKGYSNYFLDLVLTDIGGKISGILEYNTHVFSASTAKSLGENYLSILKKVTMNPDGLIDELPRFQDDAFEPPEAVATLTPANAQSAPMTRVEELVADIFKNLLHVDSIGRDTNFFEMGGHSLLVLALFSKLEARFAGVPLFAAFAENPTVASIARVIEEYRKNC